MDVVHTGCVDQLFLRSFVLHPAKIDHGLDAQLRQTRKVGGVRLRAAEDAIIYLMKIWHARRLEDRLEEIAPSQIFLQDVDSLRPRQEDHGNEY
jgi:hypothetical protein